MADSVTDFWRRWHMSLSSWFRDYVYIPLGGSRCSKGRLVWNLFAVWSLTGLWHGANWTFVCWGLWFFVLLSFEKLVWGQGAREAPGHFAAWVRDACRVHRVDFLPKLQSFLRIFLPAGAIRPRNGRAGRAFVADALYPAIRLAVSYLPAAFHKSRHKGLGTHWPGRNRDVLFGCSFCSLCSACLS